jgi:hypothetical protein
MRQPGEKSAKSRVYLGKNGVFLRSWCDKGSKTYAVLEPHHDLFIAERVSSAFGELQWLPLHSYLLQAGVGGAFKGCSAVTYGIDYGSTTGLDGLGVMRGTPTLSTNHRT